jgi:glycosyltransferase involved in cell wall biosynthesis
LGNININTESEKSVVMIVYNYFVNDNRVFRAADALRDKMYKVTLLALYKNGLKEDENTGKGFRVIRIKTGIKAPGVIKKYLKYLTFRKKAKKIVDGIRPGFVHCHDYNTLFLGLYAKRKFNSKVVYDCHEYFQDLTYLHRYPFLLRFHIAFRERRAIKKVDSMIVVSDGIRDAYKKFSNKEIFVIRNIPDESKLKSEILERENELENVLKLKKESGKKMLLYLGGNIGKGRGVNYLLELMKHLPSDFEVFFIGINSVTEKDFLENKGQEARLFGRINIFPGQKIETVIELKSYFDFGISLIEPIYFSYRYCLPNKLFEYIKMGLPIISFDIPEQARLIRKYKIGVIADKEDISHTARLIMDYIKDFEAFAKVQEEINWSKEKKIFDEIYSKYNIAK